MSLVVAQRYRDGVRLVADTRVTDPDNRDTPRVAPRTHYLEGALKVVVMHRALCVGYAGPVGDAQVALREVASTSRVTFSLPQVHIHLASASSEGPDFVVATLTPQPGLATIRNGSVYEGGNQTYVGEPQAYDRFQEALGRVGGPGNSAHDVGPLTRAMHEVIASNVVPTVGDLVTEVRCGGAGFRYTGHGIVSTGPFDLSDDYADPATWGSAAAGAYYESYLYPREAGIGALGVYFYQGQLGALFYPAKAERAIPYTDVSHQDFVAAVRVDHCIELAGSRIEAGHRRNFVLH